MHSPTCSIDGCERRRHCRGWCTSIMIGGGAPVQQTGSDLTGRSKSASGDTSIRTGQTDAGNGPASSTGQDMDGSELLPRAVRTASLASLRLFKRAIAKGQIVRHKCDNAACVNPDHLELGTQRENVRDMIERGRGNWKGAAWRTKPQRNPDRRSGSLHSSQRRARERLG
jgi:hypothetical protein